MALSDLGETAMKHLQIFRKLLHALPPVLGVLFIHTALGAAYIVPSASMQPTLKIGDEIIVSAPSYGLSTASLPFGYAFAQITQKRIFGHLPHRGDIAVFRAPANPHETWVKRVIGLPGDRITLLDGRILLNGKYCLGKIRVRIKKRTVAGILTPLSVMKKRFQTECTMTLSN